MWLLLSCGIVVAVVAVAFVAGCTIFVVRVRLHGFCSFVALLLLLLSLLLLLLLLVLWLVVVAVAFVAGCTIIFGRGWLRGFGSVVVVCPDDSYPAEFASKQCICRGDRVAKGNECLSLGQEPTASRGTEQNEGRLSDDCVQLGKLRGGKA